MKVKVCYRQTQEIPFDKWLQELELEKKTDIEEARLGHPVPRRYRLFTGSQNSQIRVHEREYDSIEEWGRMFEEWAEDEECQKIEVERHNFYIWEKEEIYFVDDPNEPMMPWLQMAAEKEVTTKYEVNPNYKMPKDQANYKG